MAEERWIFIGSDHAGYEYKNELKDMLEADGYTVADLGCFSKQSCDYPDIAREVGEKVLERDGAFGVLVCGSGTGMAIAANKLRGIRAAAVDTAKAAELARQHNDANVVTLGERMIDLETAKEIVNVFLNTDFAGEERHERRVAKIGEIEEKC